VCGSFFRIYLLIVKSKCVELSLDVTFCIK